MTERNYLCFDQVVTLRHLFSMCARKSTQNECNDTYAVPLEVEFKPFELQLERGGKGHKPRPT